MTHTRRRILALLGLAPLASLPAGRPAPVVTAGIDVGARVSEIAVFLHQCGQAPALLATGTLAQFHTEGAHA